MSILKLEMDGLKKTIQSISGLMDSLDAEEILDEAEAMLLNRVRTRYLAETDPDGVKWEPSLAGLERRAKGGTGTLFDKGTLFHSIQAYETGPNERTIGTDVPYAPFHQNGEGQVRRAFLGFSAEDVTLMEGLVLLRIKEAL